MKRVEQAKDRSTEARKTREVAARPSLIRPAIALAQSSLLPSKRNRHSFNLNIEELVLHDFNPASRYRIGEAVERELTRLFYEMGAPLNLTDDVDIAHLKGGEMNVSPGSNGETVGVQLARIIYRGLKR